MNRIFHNPAAWIHKHWLLVLLLALVLWLAGTFLYYLFTIFKRIHELIDKLKFLSDALKQKLHTILSNTYNSISNDPWPWLAAAVVIFPPVGWILVLWHLLDKTKSTPTTATTTTDLIPQSTPTTDTTTPDYTGFETGYSG